MAEVNANLLLIVRVGEKPLVRSIQYRYVDGSLGFAAIIAETWSSNLAKRRIGHPHS